MEIYNEIISKSLIDFEEIKLVLANNNIELVESKQIKERYFLNGKVNFKTANYKKILKNSYILLSINDNEYICYKSYDDYEKRKSKIKIYDEEECIDLLNHAGYKEVFTIEKNVYTYSNGINELHVINLINIGVYVSVKKQGESLENLKDILSTFDIPYQEDECDESIEKLVIRKIRRHLG